MYEEIDIQKWDRKEIYEHFTRVKSPHYAIGGNVDITPLIDFAHEKNLSTYLTLIYYMTKVVNGIDNFRYRIVDGKVVKFDKIHSNFTHKRPESDQFRYHTCPFEGSVEDFVRKTSAAISEQQTLFGGMEAVPNVIYFSCLPWIDATCITNPGMNNDDDAIPRINWGKFVKADGRVKLNVTVTVNHRFIDGFHVGKFFIGLQEEIFRLAENNNASLNINV